MARSIRWCWPSETILYDQNVATYAAVTLVWLRYGVEISGSYKVVCTKASLQRRNERCTVIYNLPWGAISGLFYTVPASGLAVNYKVQSTGVYGGAAASQPASRAFRQRNDTKFLSSSDLVIIFDITAPLMASDSSSCPRSDPNSTEEWMHGVGKRMNAGVSWIGRFPTSHPFAGSWSVRVGQWWRQKGYTYRRGGGCGGGVRGAGVVLWSSPEQH